MPVNAVAPSWLTVTGAAILGSVFGSFLNVCIYRLPQQQSLLRPPSTCPRCGRRIPWYDNVPILGWVLLRGRCRQCREPIAIQYPLVEAAVAVVWALSVWYYGPTWHALAAALFGTVLLGIAVTDARHYIIPHEFTIGGLVLGLAVSAAQGPARLVDALVGAAVGFGLLYGIGWLGTRVFRKEAMGGGDIWMMTMVGAFVGWKGVLLTVFLGALLGTIVFLPLAWLTKRHPHWQHSEGSGGAGLPLVPFGIFLAAGAAVTFVAGDAILGWYLG